MAKKTKSEVSEKEEIVEVAEVVEPNPDDARLAQLNQSGVPHQAQQFVEQVKILSHEGVENSVIGHHE